MHKLSAQVCFPTKIFFSKFLYRINAEEVIPHIFRIRNLNVFAPRCSLTVFLKQPSKFGCDENFSHGKKKLIKKEQEK